VTSARSGEEALGAAFGDPPDVAIVDMLLPSMSGYDVIRALRADERTGRTHVVVCSVLDAQDLSRGDAILAKPFRLAQLTDVLHAYARGQEG
jgi:CheY-like chemotaxis protein